MSKSDRDGMPSATKEEKQSLPKPFKSHNTSRYILGFLSIPALAAVSRVSKLFHADAGFVKKNQKHSAADLKKFLAIEPTDPANSIDDLKELLSRPTIISSLIQIFDKYIQNPHDTELKEKGLLALEYLSQSPLPHAISECVNQCIYKEKLDLAEYLINQTKHSIVAVEAVRTCIYFGGSKTLALAEKIIKKLSPQDAKLLNEIPENQTETLLTTCVRHNWIPLVILLFERNEIDLNATNKKNPPQNGFLIAIQVGYLQGDFSLFNLFLDCNREDLDLKRKVGGKTALQYCMDDYDKLDVLLHRTSSSYDSKKILKQTARLKAIMHKLVDHGWVEPTKTQSMKEKLLGIFHPSSSPSSAFVKKCYQSKKHEEKSEKTKKLTRG